MLGMDKLSARACRLWLAALLAAALLGLWVGGHAPPAGSLDDWDIPQLAAYLNRQGLALRLVSTSKEGANREKAFLTTTGQGWEDFNCLPKDPRQLHHWRGTLYCEWCPPGHEGSDLAFPPAEDCLVVGPFVLFGDRQLLDHVRALLAGHVPRDPEPPHRGGA